MTEQDNSPLTAVPGWRKAYVDKLAESWITNAEQLVYQRGNQTFRPDNHTALR